jgi:hypothetical protein
MKEQGYAAVHDRQASDLTDAVPPAPAVLANHRKLRFVLKGMRTTSGCADSHTPGAHRVSDRPEEHGERIAREIERRAPRQGTIRREFLPSQMIEYQTRVILAKLSRDSIKFSGLATEGKWRIMRQSYDGTLISEIAKQGGTRARMFEQWPKRSSLIIYKEGLAFVFGAGLIYIAGNIVAFMTSEAGNITSQSAIANLLFKIAFWGGLISLVYGIGLLSYTFIQRKKLLARRDEEHEERQVIYERLRYISPENIVFDPITGKEAPPTHIQGLISLIRREENKTSDGTV